MGAAITEAFSELSNVVLLLRGYSVAVCRDARVMTADDVLRLLERAEYARTALRVGLVGAHRGQFDEDEEGERDGLDDDDDGFPASAIGDARDDERGLGNTVDMLEWLRDRVERAQQ